MAKFKGVGMAAVNYPTGMNLGGDPSQALIHATTTGNFVITLSSTDLGQGLKTVIAQIGAEALGVPFENVLIDTADTDTGPHCMGTFASRATHRVGNAVVQAAQEARWALSRLESAQGKAPFSRQLSPPYGVFYAGWTNWLRGGLLKMQPGAARDPQQLARFAAEAGAAKPLIMAVDDIHLADGESAFILGYLVRHRAIAEDSATSPLLILFALVIRLTSGRPVLYRGARVGRAGVVYTMYKFRTLAPDAESRLGPYYGPELTTQTALEVTRLGRLMRATQLDELPQLLNVIKGDMSVVGPRPIR